MEVTTEVRYGVRRTPPRDTVVTHVFREEKVHHLVPRDSVEGGW